MIYFIKRYLRVTENQLAVRMLRLFQNELYGQFLSE